MIKRFLEFFLCLCLLAITFLSSPAHAQDQIITDASAHAMWVGVTVPTDPNGPRDSLIFSRAMGNDQWQQLYQIASPLVSLTHQQDEPAILLSNGQWMFIYQDGRSLGDDVPNGGRLVQLTSNGSAICAAAWLSGGIGSLSAASRPTTAPTGASQLALLLYQHSQWFGLTNIPDVLTNAPLSLVGNEHNLLLACLTSSTQLRFWQYTPGKPLQVLPSLTSPFKIAQFKALYGATGPVVWIAPPAGPGSILALSTHWSAPIPLPTSANLAQSTVRDLCIDGDEQFRLLYESNDQLYEQIYDRKGTATGKPTEINLQQQQDTENAPTRWLGISLVALLVLVFLTASRRQQTIARQSEQNARVALAPMARRLGAGIIDLLPYLGTVMMVLMPMNPPISTYDQAVRAMNQPGVRNPIMIAMAVYLLHTTISEIFFAKSIGKLIFGLKVINLRGGRPSVLAILARNICRLIDLPVFFLTILVSPLRQRIGDVAGGTMVVLAKTLPPESAETNLDDPVP